MKIAVLSGKGGTGKTLISVNMAASGKRSTYIDCDVEEPNGHLFLKPQNVIKEDIKVKIPFVDKSLCTGCRKCVEFCNFNALAYVNKNVVVFEGICHSCGGCSLFCPEKAMQEVDKIIGEVQVGVSKNVKVVTGMLNTGEAVGIPIIDKVLSYEDKDSDYTIIDCPPGSACPVMESIKDADYCILVAEPTLFGVHNLDMVYELVKLFNKPHGVVLNKCLENENPAEKSCIENNIKILCKIPFDEELGTINSNALIAARESKKYKELFSELLEKVTKEVKNETIINP